MNGDVLIYNTIIDISKEEYNKKINNDILTIFKSSICDNIGVDVFKQRIALSVIEQGIDNTLTDKVLGWLIELRDQYKSIDQNFIDILQEAYTNKANRGDILATTRDLCALFQERELLHYINPEIITEKLMKAGISKHESQYYHEGWYVNKKNITIYVKNIIAPYGIHDINKEDKYKIFNIGKEKNSFDPVIFLIAVNKKSKKITYHTYDPDDRQYEKTIKKMLENNFLFSIRNDV